ncbi:Mor transcription activator family protein [Lamprocystis purpurea]|jgi:DNA invertase Pin-like site-specific DNA recombinase|uniref:Mor transcription activator family protein n=1 Tax=Lamprocystis purpurea TaxID=61598 RepID=UPI0003720C23|nr:Mor transcription activator family protein [Lamprocystis purpurea]
MAPGSAPTPHQRNLRDALGPDGLAVLVRAYGGLRIRVHTKPRLDTELARRLGPEIYAQLQRWYAGEEIGVPKLLGLAAAERAQRVLQLRADGQTAGAIARAEGISLRWVRTILAREQSGTD